MFIGEDGKKIVTFFQMWEIIGCMNLFSQLDPTLSNDYNISKIFTSFHFISLLALQEVKVLNWFEF
jgi:hypothetical protein